MDWHIIAAAAATTTAIHGAMEPSNLFEKLKRLDEAIETGKIRELPMKGIDTRTKSYAVGITFMTVIGLIAYAIINAINPSVEAALQYIVAVLVLGELVLMGRLDSFHVLIEKITQKQKK